MSSEWSPTPARAQGQADASDPQAPRRFGCAGMAVMAALVGALLAVVLAGFLVLGSQTGGASIAVQHFCDALVAQDYPTAYAALDSAQQRQGTEAQFADSQRVLDRVRGPATACTFAYPQVQASSATFTLVVTRGGSTVSGALRLILERGKWKVDAYDANVI
jgi:predicted lipid-binding transport protein (Tim44 family)